MNETPCERLGFTTTPSQVFSRTDIEPNLKNWYPLFCPAYVFAQPLRAGKPYDKRRDRSTPAIYLGFSPLHACSVALVLNPLTGYVSPQFHIVFDPTISTVSGEHSAQAPRSLWQAKCGFITGPPSRYAHINKSEESPSIINPGMTIEGNGNTSEQDIAELPQECGGDDAENITTDIVPITDLAWSHKMSQTSRNHHIKATATKWTHSRVHRFNATTNTCVHKITRRIGAPQHLDQTTSTWIRN
jgi:hypothetical protein